MLIPGAGFLKGNRYFKSIDKGDGELDKQDEEGEEAPIEEEEDVLEDNDAFGKMKN